MISIKQIIERCNKLDISEQRDITEEYGELVFFNKELEQWNKIFTEIFGPACKPPGVAPSDKDEAATEEFGGIFKNQTLFKKDFDDISVIAMFWPWQDGVHTTLKVAFLNK